MYKEFLDNLKKKYNYDDTLMKVIEMSLLVMVDTYGDDEIEQILDLFENTKIFVTSDMSKTNRDKIEKSVIGNINYNIVKEEQNTYGTTIDPGAYYSYEPVYEEDMNIKGEIRWIVTNDLKDKFNAKGYQELFDTTINIPYFLHELNHAYAMRNSSYIKQDNTITLKHGMFIEKSEFDVKDDKVVFKSIEEKDIILEEMINEMYTQRQLVKLLNKQDYNEVLEELRKINHVSSSYSSTLIMLAQKFESLLTSKKLNKYRVDNDLSIKEEFNELAKKSLISKKYFNDIEPWQYFSNKCYELFELSCNGFKMNIEDYRVASAQIMIDAFAPLIAYQEIKYNNTDLNKYEEIRNKILNPEQEIKKM